MFARVLPSCDPDSTTQGMRWWQRLEKRWNEIQVGRQGSYSVERLKSFDHYCKTTPPTRVALVCVLTPLPALLIAVLLECLPLRSPSESWSANWAFWLRLGLSNLAMCLFGLSQLVVLVPELHPTFSKRLAVSVGVVCPYVATFVLGAYFVGFPIPLTWYAGGLVMAPYLPIMLLIVFGRAIFSRSSPCRPNLLRFNRYLQAGLGLGTIFPLYKALYGCVPAEYRGVVLLVMPVWKLAAKQFMVRSTRALEDLIPAIIATVVDFFSALFVSVCMSTSGSIYLSVLFIVADLGQALVEFREVRMNANAVFDLLQDLKEKSSRFRGLMKTPDTSDLTTLILAVIRDPKAFSVTSLAGVRLRACCPHPLTREQADKLESLQGSPVFGQSDSPSIVESSTRSKPTRRLQVQMARIAPTAPEIVSTGKAADGGPFPVFIANPDSGKLAKKLVHQGLQLMFHCEYLMLVEYVECIVPLIFVLYKTALEHLPNVAYYPDGAGHFGPGAAANVLVLAALEIVSLLLLYWFLQRKFAFSPLYQLAFVLETQIYMVQAQLVAECILLLQYELQHYGMDFTFQFKWLQDNKHTYS